MEKPESTWQVYDNGVLTVHAGGEGSEVYFQGPSVFYDGTATEPKAAPTEHKHYMESVEKNGEADVMKAMRLACYR